MRFSALIPLVLAAAASALPAHMSGSESGLERRGLPPPAPRNEHAGIAAEHARARRSGLAHGSGLRKVRRKKRGGKRAGKCRPRTTTSSTPAGPTGGDWGQTWSKPHGGSSSSGKGDDESSSSSHGSSSSSGWDHEVSSGDDDWSGSSTTTTGKGDTKPSQSSSSNEWGNDNESQTPSPSPSSDSGSSTSSSQGPKPSDDSNSTSTGHGGGGGGSMDKMLMPLGRGTAAWSTCPTTDGNALSCKCTQKQLLSFANTPVDEALLPLQWGQLPQVGKAPDGSTCYQQTYPGGSYGKGFSFYFQGDKSGVSMEGAKEVIFSYAVYFKEGFEWTKGGKLPGLYGGTSLESAKSCSGGRSGTRDDCFSARLMWREEGKGEIYNYFAPSAQNAYCNVPPKSLCNKNYGDSVARGSFTWATGQWTTVAQRIKLNDAGQKNGEQELFVNGQSIINLKNVEIAMHPGTTFYGVMAQSFFGGSTSDYAPSSDQTAWFKDWTLVVLA